MQKFSRLASCPKCCSDNIVKTYQEAKESIQKFVDGHFKNVDPTEEHLKLTCGNCNYSWQMECADASN